MRATLLGLLLMVTSGCDSLTVHRFGGTIIEMTLTGAGASPPGTHLELWARDEHDDVIRIIGANADGNPPGFALRPAVTFDDPCMIDDEGHLLTSPDAYPTSVTVLGVTQTPEEQAQQVKNRIAQLTGADIGGKQTKTLLAVVPPDETPQPVLGPNATAAERLTACTRYWNASPFAYTGNPQQITNPLHGLFYGVVTYTTTSPPSLYDYVRIETPIKLRNIQELWMTVESVPPKQVDLLNRGPIFLRGTPDHGGDEVEHFELTGPTASATAALEVGLDQDTVSF